MNYACYECKKPISSDINDRFIAKDGRCLCSECSKNVEPCSDHVRQLVIECEKNS